MDSTRDILQQSLMRLTSKFWVSPPLNVIGVVFVSLLLRLNIFHTFLWCISCWLWTGKCLLGSPLKKEKINQLDVFRDVNKSNKRLLVILHLTSVEQINYIFCVLLSITLEMKVHILVGSVNCKKKLWTAVPVNIKSDQSF